MRVPLRCLPRNCSGQSRLLETPPGRNSHNHKERGAEKDQENHITVPTRHAENGHSIRPEIHRNYFIDFIVFDTVAIPFLWPAT